MESTLSEVGDSKSEVAMFGKDTEALAVGDSNRFRSSIDTGIANLEMVVVEDTSGEDVSLVGDGAEIAGSGSPLAVGTVATVAADAEAGESSVERKLIIGSTYFDSIFVLRIAGEGKGSTGAGSSFDFPIRLRHIGPGVKPVESHIVGGVVVIRFLSAIERSDNEVACLGALVIVGAEIEVGSGATPAVPAVRFLFAIVDIAASLGSAGGSFGGIEAELVLGGERDRLVADDEDSEATVAVVVERSIEDNLVPLVVDALSLEMAGAVEDEGHLVGLEDSVSLVGRSDIGEIDFEIDISDSVAHRSEAEGHTVDGAVEVLVVDVSDLASDFLLVEDHEDLRLSVVAEGDSIGVSVGFESEDVVGVVVFADSLCGEGDADNSALFVIGAVGADEEFVRGVGIEFGESSVAEVGGEDRDIVPVGQLAGRCAEELVGSGDEELGHEVIPIERSRFVGNVPDVSDRRGAGLSLGEEDVVDSGRFLFAVAGIVDPSDDEEVVASGRRNGESVAFPDIGAVKADAIVERDPTILIFKTVPGIGEVVILVGIGQFLECRRNIAIGRDEEEAEVILADTIGLTLSAPDIGSVDRSAVEMDRGSAIGEDDAGDVAGSASSIVGSIFVRIVLFAGSNRLISIRNIEAELVSVCVTILAHNASIIGKLIDSGGADDPVVDSQRILDIIPLIIIGIGADSPLPSIEKRLGVVSFESSSIESVEWVVVRIGVGDEADHRRFLFVATSGADIEVVVGEGEKTIDREVLDQRGSLDGGSITPIGFKASETIEVLILVGRSHVFVPAPSEVGGSGGDTVAAEVGDEETSRDIGAFDVVDSCRGLDAVAVDIRFLTIVPAEDEIILSVGTSGSCRACKRREVTTHCASNH